MTAPDDGHGKPTIFASSERCLGFPQGRLAVVSLFLLQVSQVQPNV